MTLWLPKRQLIKLTRRAFLDAALALVCAPAIIHPADAWWQSVSQQFNPNGWNPLDKSANQTLTNANLTAQATNTTDGAVRSVVSKSAGKLYMECTWGAGSALGADNSWGIATGAANLGTVGATAAAAFLAYAGTTGNIWFNGVDSGSEVGGGAAGSTDRMALDFGNSRGWFARGAGDWNGDAGADPATNTGGIDISAIFPGSAAFLIRTSNNSSCSHTLNVGLSAFTFTVPSGFTAGWLS